MGINFVEVYYHSPELFIPLFIVPDLNALYLLMTKTIVQKKKGIIILTYHRKSTVVNIR